MSENVINGPFLKKAQKAGFTNFQFKQLDGLFIRAAAEKVLSHRSVDCDFEEGIAEFAYYKSEHQPYLFKFVIHQVGPRTVMYEVWTRDKGRVFKSGLFERAYERLTQEIESLIS